jgi:hypothetical protein
MAAGEIGCETRRQGRTGRGDEADGPRPGAAGIGNDAGGGLGQATGQFRGDGLLQARRRGTEKIVGAPVDPQDHRVARRDHVRGSGAAGEKGDLADHAARADLGQRDTRRVPP